MVFVVAEIGVNWDGNMSIVEELIKKSKKIGCDAVKFQAFNESIVANHPQKERLLKSSINFSNIEKIESIAKSSQMEWFCTPMYLDAVDLLDPYVKRYKLRQKDGQCIVNNVNSELVEKVLSKNKEVLVSSEISPVGSEYFKHHLIKWLYCVPKYPCKLQDFDFSLIKNFNGFSNHCPHFLAPLTAIILGTQIVEVHITSDKSKDFLDNNVSFDYDELENLVKLIRLVESMKF